MTNLMKSVYRELTIAGPLKVNKSRDILYYEIGGLWTGWSYEELFNFIVKYVVNIK